LKTGPTKTFYAKKAIISFIEDMEDAYIATGRMENPSKIWSQEELEANADLAN